MKKTILLSMIVFITTVSYGQKIPDHSDSTITIDFISNNKPTTYIIDSLGKTDAMIDSNGVLIVYDSFATIKMLLAGYDKLCKNAAIQGELLNMVPLKFLNDNNYFNGSKKRFIYFSNQYLKSIGNNALN